MTQSMTLAANVLAAAVARDRNQASVRQIEAIIPALASNLNTGINVLQWPPLSSNGRNILMVSSPSLRVPVWAELATRPGYFTLTDAVTGIFGVGPTPLAVLEDFIAALQEDAEVLTDAQVPLSAEMQSQLSYLQAHLA
jgi:hypothetical protein